jgi:hypothetical protein
VRIHNARWQDCNLWRLNELSHPEHCERVHLAFFTMLLRSSGRMSDELIELDPFRTV